MASATKEKPMSTIHQAGLTLIEVMVSALILVLGMGSLIYLTQYGVRLGVRAQNDMTGMATALTALVDATPLNPEPNAAQTNLDLSAPLMMNGYYVNRTILSGDLMPTAPFIGTTTGSSFGVPGGVMQEVQVKAYASDDASGDLVASLRHPYLVKLP
jgi:Tfp pilus assembly protein PilV